MELGQRCGQREALVKQETDGNDSGAGVAPGDIEQVGARGIKN
jgi:hypothetical protein